MANGKKMTPAEMEARLKQLEEENEKLKQPKAMSFKVSEKGALSVYGLGRFPVTLYKEQWARVLNAADDIRAFIKDNDKRLTSKE